MNLGDDQAAAADSGAEQAGDTNPSKLVRFDFPPGTTPEQIAEALRKLAQGESTDADETR